MAQQENQSILERLEAAEASVAALQEFAEVLVRNSVGGPELQRALREIDRRKVLRSRTDSKD